MLWWLILGLAGLAIAAGAWGAGALDDETERRGVAHAAAVALYLLLAMWIVGQAGARAFTGSESHHLGYFVAGLVVLAAGEWASGWASAAVASWAPAATAIAAVMFALGFKVFELHPYAPVPAVILIVLVLLVMVQASRRLAAAKTGRRKPSASQVQWRNVYISAIGLLVYAAFYKLIERGWPMASAYSAAIGALLLALAQLWWGYSVVLRQQVAAPWLRRLALQAGVLLMVVGAFFVYKGFL
ncbi:MAG: hypothetical protein KIS88_07485 [Anaerolineales bacterium]|nr:hypothetical protein [Anaerolineales bacterium]